ncbi:MAG: phosphoenolpyruvate carboxylase [Gammaproteobacteria bacterium]|nr:phosphoenolpyruvate carboxylase [Gammaproteobacteria bacterium]
MQNQQDNQDALRSDVRLLGDILGETIKTQHSSSLYDLVEEVREISKGARTGESKTTKELVEKLSKLDSDKLFNLARSFTLFLNLANIAEQQHQVRQRRLSFVSNTSEGTDCVDGFIESELSKIVKSGIGQEAIHQHICKLNINLVLTAHPTEVLRRSVSSKFLRISRLLEEQDRHDLSDLESFEIKQSLKRAITEVWETDEIRRLRPTPVDEAKTGLVNVEHSLWHVIPTVLRELDQATQRITGNRLPLDATPITFGSWMGGDRDGNPNVTPAVTKQVCALSRMRAAELFWQEVDDLRRDLSMVKCDSHVRAVVGDEAPEPYRALLQIVLGKLRATISYYEEQFAADFTDPNVLRKHPPRTIYRYKSELRGQLMLCYQSLVSTGAQTIAEGRLTDILRRLDAFGLTLLKLDIRQEADKHTQAIDTITQYLEIGSYLEWNEEERQAFLVQELTNKRPLIDSTFPTAGQASSEVIDVLNTFRMIAHENSESFGAYVISMASNPSDVLAVELLQRECRILEPLRVVPLFERLDDLNGARQCMDRLFSIDWYKERIQGRQEVMIGYSDSAKDAGKLAASWGLYQTQEELVEVFTKHNVDITLFHGRGGTVARGGGPAHEAIRSQPPGSVNCSMRVTEQGEVIQAKYGLPGMATETLQVYIGAVLETTLLPPPKPATHWRQQVSKLATRSLEEFHDIVRHHPQFIEYFQLATPEQELSNLKIGSRPARRRKGGGIQYLRAIPWIFAWTQTRLMLPAWLGVGSALQEAFDNGEKELLIEMQKNWPFFTATMSSIEMVFSKANPKISSIYDDRLVPISLQPFGETLRDKYKQTVDLVLNVTEHAIPLENEPVVRQSVNVRNTYVIPLNILQVELLSRVRHEKDDIVLDALLVAINGIAAGMRNTG